MKNIILFSFLLFSGISQAQAADFVIAMSPFQEAGQAKKQAKQVLKFLTRQKAGQKAILIDGYHLKTIGTFSIPENKLYKSPKARISFNRKTVGALMRFAKQAAMAGENEPSTPAAVRLPQLLRHVAENYAASDLIILGSPFYDEEAEFSMADGHIPSDGHLLSSRAKSPFGTLDNPELLSNIRVHFGIDDKAVMLNDQHSYFVKRFWTLLIEKQGGKLVSYTADLEAVYQRVQNSAKATRHHYKAEPSKKLEMIRFRKDATGISIYDRALSKKPLPRQKVKYAREVEVGINWNCECDIDLYARSTPSAAILYFNNGATPEGTHWKDLRSSTRAANAFETISFDVPLDLRKLRIVINFFEGKSPNGVSGEIRIMVDGNTYAKKFKIKANSGNSGVGVTKAFRTGIAQSSHMLVIDPLKIVDAK